MSSADPCRRRALVPDEDEPELADTLAQLRRQSWTLWISDQAARGHLDQNGLAPLLDAVGYGSLRRRARTQRQ